MDSLFLLYSSIPKFHHNSNAVHRERKKKRRTCLADLEGEAVRGETWVRAGETRIRRGSLNFEREMERAGRWQSRDEDEHGEVNMGPPPLNPPLARSERS